MLKNLIKKNTKVMLQVKILDDILYKNLKICES